MAREKVIQELLDTLHETLKYFDADSKTLGTSYGTSKWTLRQILVHISDTETVLLDRLRRLAAEKKAMLMAFDENDWAAALLYKERDLNLARQQFEAARRNVIELARILPADVDTRTGTHSASGTRTFGQVIGHIAEHNAHHLEQVRAIAAGKQWKPKK